MKSWIEISAQRLTANYRLLVEAAADTSVLAVVKADAYGHGAQLCAPVLAQAGAAWLGVTDAAEGAAVRAALTAQGVSPEQQPRVLVMSEAHDEDARLTLEHRLTPVVSSVLQMQSLAHAARERGIQLVDVHLEIDTGMARQGVAPGDDLEEVLQWLIQQSVVRLDGVMTHFASAEVTGSHQTAQQRRLFEQAILQVVSAGLRPKWIHAGNSSTIDNQNDEAGTGESPLCWLRKLAHMAEANPMVRSGLSLYGYSLPLECEQNYAGRSEPLVHPCLQPIMTWKARVTHVREVEPGMKIGYNGTLTAARSMRLALLPIGYADGLRRELSGTDVRAGGWVLFGSQAAAIVGRVSMNLTIVDVTALPSVAVGDEAVVLGKGITAEDHARLAATIPYEILCGIKAPRLLL
ncbi:alanine racemase [Edaphobacter sp. HDX4]|uniref:alanine racemase n=1 Tax=Edaphobacter sp. HDX4 TaxID=2794064 RepID=UPI002FE62999